MSQEWFVSSINPSLSGKFEDVEEVDGEASRKANNGKNVYKKVCAIHERAAGHNDVSPTLITAENLEVFKARFPGAWEAYQNLPRPPLAGTPLEALSFLTKSQITLLQAQAFSTVEQLAGMSDASVQAMGANAFALRKASQEYLEALEKKDIERDRQDRAIVREAAAEIKEQARTRKKSKAEIAEDAVAASLPQS